MELSFKKWFEAVQQPEPVKQEPELPYPGEDFPPGQTHAMPTYTMGDDPQLKRPKKMKKTAKRQ